MTYFDKKNIQLIIPMSGIGKRFMDAGYDNIKPLILVDNIPILQHVVNLFPGIDDVIFICNNQHLIDRKIEETLKTICPSCKIIGIDPNKKGPVYTVSKAFDFIDESKEIIISYCDYGTEWDFDKFLEVIHKWNFDGSIPCYTGFHPHMLGNDNYAFCQENEMMLTKIKEKESFTNNKMNEYASNGTYYFKRGSDVIKYFKLLMDMDIHVKNEYYISLVYNLLIQDGLKINIFKINKMLQWGTPYDLESYNYWSGYFKNIIQLQENINNPPNTTLILPMAGNGSRFYSNGFTIPKPLLDINGLPMVVQAVKCLPDSNHIVFVCLNEHYNKYNLESIKSYCPNSDIVKINEVTDGQATTCEIGITRSKININSPILISASDNGVFFDQSKYKKIIDDESIDVIVWTFRNNQTSKINPSAYSWINVDENNFAIEVSCKKFIYENPLKTHAIIGTMFFRKAQYFLDGYYKNKCEDIKTNGEFYVDDVLTQNIKSGLKVKVFEVDYYICWGTPNDYNTYLYWQEFFDKCTWHPYKKIKDITYHKSE